MDKRAFKQRMQNLKSYRENNPGKGYIEFMEDLAKFKAKEWGENEDIILTEMLNDNTYNYKQMYEDNPNYNIQEGHFQDTYKTVYHPTFSKESMYSGKKSQYNPEGITGGWWDYNNKIFHAGYKQDIRNTQKYLNQEDPGWKVKAFQDGGEASDPKKEKFFQATGRSSSGRPLEEGLKPVFSLEDAANMTPIGDAISARDTYNAVKNRDWLGAGLAALTVMPFVPNAIKRATPTVRRTGTDQIDRILRAQNKEAKMATRLNNETYNIAERLMDNPSYMRRAQQVKNKYGDDYTSIYADIINTYNESPELLPKAKGSLSLGEARGKMQTQGSATTRHKEGGDFPKIGEYDYMFNIDRGVPYGSTTHEINHFSDFLKNQSPDAVGSSNMYKWMRSAIKPYSDSVSKYFSSPTEQKAYMNQLREFMYANKMIDTRDQVVTPSLIKTALDKLPKGMDSVKKASDQFKSLKSYTKWFNTVPLLGVGAIGANKYFTNNESRN